MLKELKFVSGAVAKKEFIPAITHFCIENGTVRAYNGTLALSSPIACDINCKPKAVPMVNAIARCSETITMSVTPTGKLSIKSGPFRALIECVPEETVQAHVMPEGERIEFDGQALLTALKTILPFVGNDASRPWATGILLKGQSAYATNNVCLIEYWVGAQFPHVVNVPRPAVVEMIRINEAPTHAQLTDTSITFHYGDGRWIRSQLFATDWPDVERLLDGESHPKSIPAELFDGLKVVKPFMGKLGQIFINEAFMHTHQDISEGATFDLAWFESGTSFSLDMLLLLEGVAKTADFSMYPSPCAFFGDRLRGVIGCMRV